MRVSECVIVTLVHLLMTVESLTYQCITSSGLNTDHQFHCCYTNRNPKCQNICVENKRVCDGTPDCPDGRDEWTSLCSQTCTLGYEGFKGFQCKRAWRRCLSFNRLCDERSDCTETELADNSDEDDCECFYNKDCPFYGNLSATLPPAPTSEATLAPPESKTNYVAVVISLVVIALLLLIAVIIGVFLAKHHFGKRNHDTRTGAHPSAPSPPSSRSISSPSRRPLDHSITPILDAPPPYDEIEAAGSRRPGVS